MACVNVNAPEFKKLQEVFGSDLKTEIYVKKWQRLNKSDDIPTVEFLENMIKLQDIEANQKKQEFTNMLLANLVDAGLAEKKGNRVFVKQNMSNQGTVVNQTSRIYNYLTFNRIPKNILTVTKTKNGGMILIDKNAMNANDLITKSTSKDLVNAPLLLSHLKKVFPAVNIKVLPAKEAEQLFLSTPVEDRTSVEFEQVKSFYDPSTQTSYLIRERFDDDTAIEEVLHPFVDSLYVDNKELFDSLHQEAQQNFPELFKDISKKYTNRRGFTALDRERELITQALTRHFAREYETKPTKSFLEKAKEFVKWFFNTFVEKMHRLISGNFISKKEVDVAEDIKLETTIKDVNGFLNKVEESLSAEDLIDFDSTYNALYEKAIKYGFTPNDIYNVFRNISAPLRDSLSILNIPKYKEKEIYDISKKNALEGINEFKQVIDAFVAPKEIDDILSKLEKEYKSENYEEAQKTAIALSKSFNDWATQLNPNPTFSDAAGAKHIAEHYHKLKKEKSETGIEESELINTVKDLFKTLEIMENIQDANQGEIIDVEIPDDLLSDLKAVNKLRDWLEKYNGSVEERSFLYENYPARLGLDKMRLIQDIMMLKADITKILKENLSKLLQNKNVDLDMLNSMLFFEVPQRTPDKLFPEYNLLKEGELLTKSTKDENFQVAKLIVDGILDAKSEDVVEETQVVNIEDLSSTATLSDVAKLLNTSDITIDVSKRLDTKLQFSLSDQKKKQVEFIKSRAKTKIQKDLVDALSGNKIISELDTDEFVVTDRRFKDNLVIQNEQDKFINPITNQQYESVKTLISGAVYDTNTIQYKISKDLSAILEAKLTNIDISDIREGLLELHDEKYDSFIEGFSEKLYDIRKQASDNNSVLLPNVVIYDIENQHNGKPIADKIDLIEITTDGKLKIINILSTGIDLTVKKNKSKYTNKKFELGPSSMFIEQEKLSQSVQDNLKISIQQIILNNMGYEISYEKDSLKTLHLFTKIKNNTLESLDLNSQKIHDLSKTNDLISGFTILEQKDIDEQVEEDIEEDVEEDYDDEYEDILDEDSLELNKDMFVIDEALENYRTALLTKKDAIRNIRSSIYSFRSPDDQKEYIQHSLSLISLILNAGKPKDKRALFTRLVRDAIKEVDAFIEYLKNPRNFSKKEYITYALNAKRFAATFQGLYSIKNAIELNPNIKQLLFNLQTGLNELTGNFSEKSNLTDEAISNFVANTIESTTSQDLSEDDIDGLMKYARDIGLGEYLTRDWATSTDVILRVMNKIFHNDKMKFHEDISLKEERIKQVAAKLLKLSPTNDRQKIFLYMLNPDATTVEALNPEFVSMLAKLHDAVMDPNGNPLKYKEIYDEMDASEEDLQYNRDLAEKKRKRAEALSAEIIDENGYEDGEYYRYTDEFKKYRDKYEEFIDGIWVFKDGYNERTKVAYYTKFYNEVEYFKAVRVNGEYTGQIEKVYGRFVKKEYKEVRLDTYFKSNSGEMQSMENERYKKIMNPTTALERTQKEFYLVYKDIYEEELNSYGPGVFKMMQTRIPVIPSRVNQKLAQKGSFFSKMYAGMARKYESFTSNGTKFKNVLLDEQGNIQERLPMMYIGKPRDEARLAEVKEQIRLLKQKYKNDQISTLEYDKKIKDLNGERDKLVSRPATNEISRDLATSLLQFMSYAERYKTLTQTEDTLQAMVKVIENRAYLPSSTKTKNGIYKDGKFIEKAVIKGSDSNTLKKAKEFMSMIFYDSEKYAKGMTEKFVDTAISYTSLNLVSANPFGSFNNYLFGRISNYIEVAGGRFFDRKAYLRAEYEYNKQAIPALFYRLSAATKRIKGGNFYDPEKPGNKYEALVGFFRMMDPEGDLRETAAEFSDQSLFSRFANFSYILQDATEYNVQTKIGMAMLMSTYIKNQDTGDIMNLYDAFEYDTTTQSPKLKEGYTMIVSKSKVNGNWIEKGEFTDKFRFNLRSKIREVNKIVHGNYARDDRMVIQKYTLGKLFAQFHKWVAPAITTRIGKEYYDENLGWMEGRIRSWAKFTHFSTKELIKGNLMFGSYKNKFFKKYTGDDLLDADLTITEQELERLENQFYGFKKTVGEILFAIFVFGAGFALKEGMGIDDEEEKEKKFTYVSTGKKTKESYIIRRFLNFLLYQADRTYKDLATFLPFVDPAQSFQQIYQLFKTPIATTKTIGEVGDFLEHLMWTPFSRLYMTEEEIKADPYYTYQRGTKAGESKLKKEFYDIFPYLYAAQKWVSFDTVSNYYIK